MGEIYFNGAQVIGGIYLNGVQATGQIIKDSSVVQGVTWGPWEYSGVVPLTSYREALSGSYRDYFLAYHGNVIYSTGSLPSTILLSSPYWDALTGYSYEKGAVASGDYYYYIRRSLAPNFKPVANAGPDQAYDALPSTIQLDGSGSSDPENKSLTYLWTMVSRPAGSSAALVNSTSVNPTFPPDVAGDYVVKLQVSDGYWVVEDTVTVTVLGTGWLYSTSTPWFYFSSGLDSYGQPETIIMWNSVVVYSVIGQALTKYFDGSHTYIMGTTVTGTYHYIRRFLGNV